MRSSKHSPTPPNRGFTLAAVLVVMAAILLLAVGALALVGIERKTARSYVDARRAEWMAESGMEDFRVRLKELTANDHYLVFSKADEEVDPLREPADYLFLARGSGGGDGLTFEVTPLFSAEFGTEEVGDLEETGDVGDFRGMEPTAFETLPWADEVQVDWIEVKDDANRVVGRYAYWVEDLQGKLDASKAASDLARVEHPLTAPGVALDPDDGAREGVELAFYALDPESEGDEDDSTLDDRLEEGRELLVSPGAVLAAAGIRPPLERDEQGALEDELAGVLERHVAVGLQPYEERPVVPFTAGISDEAAGQPKRNLNEMLLDQSTEAAVNSFADWVDEALPEFAERGGGFPDDYLRTMAANALDYADADNEPTLREGVYRGLDGYPLVSEHLVRYRWDKVSTRDGRKYVEITVKVVAELWNMTDQAVGGEMQLSYETNYQFPLGPVPDLNLGAPEFIEDPDVFSPQLEKSNGYYWFPAQNVAMEPNEYRLMVFPELKYVIDAGPSSVFVPSPIYMTGEDLWTSAGTNVGYRMRWNGKMVDQSRGYVVHPDMSLNYPADTQKQPRQNVWGTIPGHSYSTAPFQHANNMGDPRMAFYIGLPQDPNDYPDNYSPNRRTVRWGNIYQGDGSTKAKVYGRVMPSEWPDGGHNTGFGSIPSAVSAGRGGQDGDQRIDPDHAQFFQNIPETEPYKAPMRISNLGRFVSESELGRVYDPVMWLPTYDNTSETNQIRRGLMPGSRASWPLVVEAAPPSGDYGGGNSLRIGRPEHPKFDVPGLHAAHLLDLFHAGMEGDEDDITGDRVRIDGKVNLNTASREVLRALAVGYLKQDPVLAEQLSRSHQPTHLMAPPTRSAEEGAPRLEIAGDVLADAIILRRPITCAAELAAVKTAEDEPVFGNPEFHQLGEDLEWNDSAAEEVFERVYNASTLRSRNFRVWVVGQSLAPKEADSTSAPVVMAESRKVFTIFADPGDRTDSGDIDSSNYRPRVIHENGF